MWLAQQATTSLQMTTTFLVEVDFLDFFEEPHFFKALFAGKNAGIQLNRLHTDISIWVTKAIEKTALPGIVCNFAFSSMCCIFFGQLLRYAAQTRLTLLCTSTPVWKHPGVSLIF